MANYQKAKLWIFDCDGVLLDSNKMKTSAFSAAISSYPEDKTIPFLNFQKTSFGMSRFRTIDVFFSEYLNREELPGEKERIISDFSQYCRDNYPHQPITKGTLSLLKELKRRGLPTYVASGSEQEELRYTLGKIGISKYFKDILGSPRNKKDIISGILKIENDINDQDVVFFGDAKADFDAAFDNRISFIQVKAYSSDPEGMEKLRNLKRFLCVNTLEDVTI